MLPKLKTIAIVATLAALTARCWGGLLTQDTSGKAENTQAKSEGPGTRSIGGSSTNGYDRNASTYSQLLLSRQVQKELSITSAQVRSINLIWDIYAKQLTEVRSQRRLAKPDTEERAMVEVEIQKREQAFQNALGQKLTARQRDRLWELIVQNLGPKACALPVIAEKLNIDPDTYDQIVTIVEMGDAMDAETRRDASKKYRATRDLIPNDDYAALAKHYGDPAQKALAANMRLQLREGSKRVDQKILRLLTKRQKAKLHKMMGEPLVVPPADEKVPAKPRGEPEDGSDKQSSGQPRAELPGKSRGPTLDDPLRPLPPGLALSIRPASMR